MLALDTREKGHFKCLELSFHDGFKKYIYFQNCEKVQMQFVGVSV